jgi:DeoR/GlpR family transcriptional regulator of sugar metabolism
MKVSRITIKRDLQKLKNKAFLNAQVVTVEVIGQLKLNGNEIPE